MKTTKILAAAALFASTQACLAIPLTLNYQVTNLGSTYQYNFDLVLDNHDNSWTAGQQWDWIVFGDRVGGFPNAEAITCSNWVWGSSETGVAGACSSGFHQGNAVAFGANGVTLPGWMPAFIGDTLSWSGTSTTLVADGDMYWSPVITGNGATGGGTFNLANRTSSVSEPSPLLLLSVGLLGLGAMRRKKV